MLIAFPHIFCATLIVPIVSWNLSYFAPPHASIGQVAVWRNRAFICLPRYDLGTIRATLLETPWPESVYLTRQLTQQVKPEFTSSKLGCNQSKLREIYITSLLYISNEITKLIIQGDSLARGPKLLSIKNYVIKIMT